MITAFYAGLLGLLYIALSVLVIKSRVKHGVPLLDNNVSDIQRRIRAHGNFSEYVPLFLILMLLCEMQSMNLQWLHILGAVFFLGRISHALSLIKFEDLKSKNFMKTMRFRTVGMMATFGSLLILSVYLINNAVNSLDLPF